jgi:hypothetical protein
MRVWIVLAMCACNPVFGLRETQARDAQLFDAPADAPFQCPPIGMAPQFSPLLHQVGSQFCLQYTIVAGHAVAVCRAGDIFVVSEGPVDQLLVPAVGVDTPPLDEVYEQPRLSSDANELYVRHFNYSTNVQDVVMFTRTGSGWQRGPAPPFGTGFSDSIGGLARGPTGDRVIVTSFSDGVAREWAHEGSTWRAVLQHPFGLAAPNVVQMTSDGLRAVIFAPFGNPNQHLYYSDRPDEESPFRTAVPLSGTPLHSDAALTDDCARLYVTGVATVFYVQQL